MCKRVPANLNQKKGSLEHGVPPCVHTAHALVQFKRRSCVQAVTVDCNDEIYISLNKLRCRRRRREEMAEEMAGTTGGGSARAGGSGVWSGVSFN